MTKQMTIVVISSLRVKPQFYCIWGTRGAYHDDETVNLLICLDILGIWRKILYSNFYGKMHYANSADPDQTAPEVWAESALFAIPPNILWNKYIKTKFRQKSIE